MSATPSDPVGRVGLRHGERDPAMLDVWTLDLSAAARDAACYWEVLNAEERERAERFRNDQARRNFLVTRGRLRQLLGDYLGVPMDRVSLVIGERGKPRLRDSEENGGLVFNVSHSGDRAVLAFAQDTALGADVESVRPRRDVQALARQCLSETEWRHWLDNPPELGLAEFIRYWVCKEAFVKATGQGLAAGMQTVEVQRDFSVFERVPDVYGPPDRWHLSEWGEDGYRYAVSYFGVPRRIRFRT